MSAPPSVKPPTTAWPSPSSGAATRNTVLPCASTRRPRRLRCSASMVGATGEMFARAAEELEGVSDFEAYSLMAVSPLDGRYVHKVEDLRPFFIEYGLIRYRVLVEVKWLLKLSQIPEIAEVPAFSEETQRFLDSVIQDFDIDDAKEVKRTEKKTNHDVKAAEYFLKQKCSSNPEVAKVMEFFHFACTSEDINNLSHALALKEAVNTVLFPEMIDLCKAICSMAKKNSHIPMLSGTHGQPASPTTLGKEMANFAARLSDKGKSFANIRVLGKFAGAVGKYNSHMVAYPHISWPNVAAEFITLLRIGI